jgi:hypothetical protein
MCYSQIDAVLVPWAKTRGLFVATEFKDVDVRSIHIVDDAGDSYGLWIETPRADGSVTVGIAENATSGSRRLSQKIRKQIFTTNVSDLGQILESAYAVAEAWMRERGHTRTPAL